MPESPAAPLLEALVNDFGANYTFALDLLEQYRSDRASVETSWGQYFDRLLGVPAPPPAPATMAALGRANRNSSTRTRSAVRRIPAWCS